MQAIASDIGPGHRLPSLHTLFAPVVFSKLRRGRPCLGNARRGVVNCAVEIACCIVERFSVAAMGRRSSPASTRMVFPLGMPEPGMQRTGSDEASLLRWFQI